MNVINAMAKKRKKPMAMMLSRIGAPASKFARRVGEGVGENVPRFEPSVYRASREE